MKMLCYIKEVLNLPGAHSTSWGPRFSNGRPMLPSLLVGNETGEVWNVKFPAVAQDPQDRDAQILSDFSEYSTEELASKHAVS